MDFSREIEGKQLHDPLYANWRMSRRFGDCVQVSGPIIVGAGPSGLAVAACLNQRGIRSIILEKSDCIASLWQRKTYGRLRLHLPKQFCELPMMGFPRASPTYPDKREFVKYLEDYAKRFGIRPQFNETVEAAEYDGEIGQWRVRSMGPKEGEKTEYVCQWLVVATGENAEPVVPEIEGMEGFGGPIKHTSMYSSGEEFRGKRVLVVGCGNSGMEVCLDLCNHNAMPSLVVRDTVHVLPRDVLGKSTFALSMWLLKWLPMRLVDQLLLLAARVMLGDTARLGLKRPKVGPLELKNLNGKTPVLDVGTLAKIKSGDIKVYPGIRRLNPHEVKFLDCRSEKFDAIVLATGYKSNVPTWLKEGSMFSKDDGFPRRAFPNGWKGERGLYAVGFTRRGLLGVSMDAGRIAEDIERCWKEEEKHRIQVPNFLFPKSS